MSFRRIVHVVNRTFDDLEVMDNGVVWVIRPGYKRVEKLVDGVLTECIVGAGLSETVFLEPLPYFAAERAKRQNPVMGTVDPLNPNAFESLIGVPDWGDDCTPREQSDAIELLDRSKLGDEAQKAVLFIPIGGRKPPKMTRKERKAAQKAQRAARNGIVVPELNNPLGIRTVEA